MTRRRWEVWALYDRPVLVERCWTRSGAVRATSHHWWPTRYWLSYEIRDTREIEPPETWGNWNSVWATGKETP